jgi:hypothetical protein
MPSTSSLKQLHQQQKLLLSNKHPTVTAPVMKTTKWLALRTPGPGLSTAPSSTPSDTDGVNHVMTAPPFVASFLPRVEDCAKGIALYMNEYRILIDTMPPPHLESYDWTVYGGDCQELQNILCYLQQTTHEWYRTNVRETTDVYTAVHTLLNGLQELYTPVPNTGPQQELLLDHFIDVVDRKQYELPEEMRCDSRQYAHVFSTEPTAVQDWIFRVSLVHQSWAKCRAAIEATLNEFASVFTGDDILSNKMRITLDSRCVVTSTCKLLHQKLAELYALDATNASNATNSIITAIVSGLSELHPTTTSEEQNSVLRGIQQQIDKRNGCIRLREKQMKELFGNSVFFTVHPSPSQNY